jgi:hypothetical protein
MNIDDRELADAIESTFERRKTPLPDNIPLVFTDDFINDGAKETQWRAFLKRSLLVDFDLPFSQVVHDLKQTLWPLVLQLHSE